MTRLIDLRALPVILLAAAASSCGAERRVGSVGPLDAAEPEDLGVRTQDMVAPRDLEPITPPPDLSPEPEPDLARAGCSMVGQWDLGLDNLLTLDRGGGLNFELGPFGAYRQDGGKLSVQDDFSDECVILGQYAIDFSKDCSTVSVRVIADPCVERTKVFEAKDWVRR